MRSARRQYHASSAGLIYLLVTVFLGVGAVNSQNNLLFLAFGLALGALLVSGLVSGMMLLHLEVERESPNSTTVGEAVRIRYRVRNTSRRVPAFALRISEARGRRKRRDSQPVRDWTKFFPAPEAFIPHLARHGVRYVEALVPAMARGDARLNLIRVDTRFPFGIIRKSVVFEQPDHVLIRPEQIAAEGVSPFASGILDAQDAAERPTLGRGLEFLGVREYVPGDSRRSIAWRPSARRGELVVREHMTPMPQRTTICVDLAGDAQRDGRRPNMNESPESDANERAISMAAWFVDRLARAGNDVALEAPRAGITTGFSAAGMTGVPMTTRWKGHLMDALASIDLAALVDRESAAWAPGRGSSVIVVHAGEWSDQNWPASATHVDASIPEEGAAESSRAASPTVIAGTAA